MKFTLGQLVATPGAIDALENDNLLAYVAKHSRGDWGEICPADKKLNNQALKDGTRLLSAYTIKNGRKIWIITEADRSATTVLLPEEY